MNTLMKLIALAFIVLPAQAFAQGVIGGGGGLGPMKTSLVSTLFPKNVYPCVEGTKKIFFERDYTQDSSVTVVRECKNGRYFQKATPNYNRKCYEGTRSIVEEDIPASDNKLVRHYKCINGKRVLLFINTRYH